MRARKGSPLRTTPRDSPETISKQLAQVWDSFTRLACINCWHQNDAESIAMWKLYTSGAEGVAIQTTVGRIKNALQGARRPVRIAAVQYIHHQSSDDVEAIERTTNPMLSVLSKREVFSHEREIQVVIDYLEDVASRAPRLRTVLRLRYRANSPATKRARIWLSILIF